MINFTRTFESIQRMEGKVSNENSGTENIISKIKNSIKGLYNSSDTAE